ncbi:hypothetical protein PABY_12730 [Pyrodictium abyssi]|uniref:Uncharacterized protein n=1 Tax=Pyrodictium abyssi TaxID=54256 RepID=A0ABN6ZN73_9CREN|nr:hypothetical protein PABY_12730 [Pyrodictium abyssi]
MDVGEDYAQEALDRQDTMELDSLIFQFSIELCLVLNVWFPVGNSARPGISLSICLVFNETWRVPTAAFKSADYVFSWT